MKRQIITALSITLLFSSAFTLNAGKNKNKKKQVSEQNDTATIPQKRMTHEEATPTPNSDLDDKDNFLPLDPAAIPTNQSALTDSAAIPTNQSALTKKEELLAKKVILSWQLYVINKKLTPSIATNAPDEDYEKLSTSSLHENNVEASNNSNTNNNNNNNNNVMPTPSTTSSNNSGWFGWWGSSK